MTDADRTAEAIARGETEIAATLMGTIKTPEDAVAFIVREVGPDRPIGEAVPYLTGWLHAMLTGDFLKGYDKGYGDAQQGRAHGYRDYWPRWTPRRPL